MQHLTGTQYLQCEIACKHDKAMEKEVWDTRLSHFASIDLDDPKTFKSASNPIGLRAAHVAYQKAINQEPIGYMISLDATSSGLQILSLLVSCPDSWNLCGGRNDTCESAYRVIYDAMGVSETLTQKEVKDTIMTAFYGSTAMPSNTFGENVDTFYNTVEALAPGAWNLNLGLQSLWDEVGDSIYSWILPDNFHACIETKDKEFVPFTFLDEHYKLPVKVDGRPEFHKGLGPNLVHSIDGLIVREMLRRCMFDRKVINRVCDAIATTNPGKTGRSAPMVKILWDRYLETGFLSARIFDYIHGDTIGLVDVNIIFDLLDTLPTKPFDVVTVHD